MTPLELNEVPVAKTGMLIRRPVAEVFEAFVDPAITRRYWFSRGSDRLAPGRQVQWEWEMYGFPVPVDVRVVEPHRRIIVEWPGLAGPTLVQWDFTAIEDSTTFVRIANTGFRGEGDSVAAQAQDSTQGFSLVLAGLKAWLEHGIELNLVRDRFPAGIEEH